MDLYATIYDSPCDGIDHWKAFVIEGRMTQRFRGSKIPEMIDYFSR